MTVNVQPFSKTHRTAIVFDARGALNSERAKRLIESVNGNQIKVDFFTLTGSGLATGTPAAQPTYVAAAPAVSASGGGHTLAPGTPFDQAPATAVAAAEEHVHDEVRTALSGYDLVAIVA